MLVLWGKRDLPHLRRKRQGEQLDAGDHPHLPGAELHRLLPGRQVPLLWRQRQGLKGFSP